MIVINLECFTQGHCPRTEYLFTRNRDPRLPLSAAHPPLHQKTKPCEFCTGGSSQTRENTDWIGIGSFWKIYSLRATQDISSPHFQKLRRVKCAARLLREALITVTWAPHFKSVHSVSRSYQWPPSLFSKLRGQKYGSLCGGPWKSDTFTPVWTIRNSSIGNTALICLLQFKITHF